MNVIAEPAWVADNWDMTEEALDQAWLNSFAEKLSLTPLAEPTIAALLELAGTAARESGDRRNAPISCFLAGLTIGASGSPVTPEAIESIGTD